MQHHNAVDARQRRINEQKVGLQLPHGCKRLCAILCDTGKFQVGGLFDRRRDTGTKIAVVVRNQNSNFLFHVVMLHPSYQKT